jgi:hypothetical protein
MSEEQPKLYCANHPQIETTLRCNRCEKPICPKCAVLTPTGYRCKECVRGQQKTFDTAQWYDYPLAVAIGGVLSFLGSQFVPVMSFFTIFVAPVAGVIIAEIIRFIIRRRRSKRLYLATAIAVAVGSLPFLGLMLFNLLVGFGGFGVLLPLLWQGLYSFLVTSTVYYRMSGISIG